RRRPAPRVDRARPSERRARSDVPESRMNVAVHLRRLPALAFAAASVALASCGAERPAAAVLAIGAPAPAYAAQRMDGTPIALADLKGEVVMLNVWATWCKPCREEIPALDSLHREFGPRGFRVVGVSIDVAGDTAEIAG